MNIIRPVITEQSMKHAAKGVYTFEVMLSSRKEQIVADIQRLYGVHVVGIRTVRRKGVEKRVGKKRIARMQPDKKIARISVKQGEKIASFEYSSESSV